MWKQCTLHGFATSWTRRRNVQFPYLPDFFCLHELKPAAKHPSASVVTLFIVKDSLQFKSVLAHWTPPSRSSPMLNSGGRVAVHWPCCRCFPSTPVSHLLHILFSLCNMMTCFLVVTFSQTTSHVWVADTNGVFFRQFLRGLLYWRSFSTAMGFLCSAIAASLVGHVLFVWSCHHFPTFVG